MDTPDLISPMPQFRQPIPPREDPPLADSPPPDPTQPPRLLEEAPSPAGRGSLLERFLPPGRKPAGDTPTGTSSTRSADAPAASVRDAEAVMAGLVGVAAAVATWMVRRRRRSVTLRRPSTGEADDIGRPLGRILYRHAAKYWGWLGPDLADLIKAGAATGAWLNAGPLTMPAFPDAGVPADLQEESE